MSETRSSFLPVIAVQVVHLLVQLGMALLLSFHPHSFLSHLLPPELLAALPKVKVKANKGFSSKFSLSSKDKNQIKSRVSKALDRS